MGNKYFKFKQFTVFHDKCAMKVGTDGVLLGAWADFENRRSILDVGTGSGLIALMAAQRNNMAEITALEIDPEAASQAKENVENSRFKHRISVLPLSFEDFVSSATDKFDLIVSNPPFFVNALLSPDVKRTGARHADSLSVAELFGLGKKLVSETGNLSLIYPFPERENIMSVAEKEGFYLARETAVFSTPASPAKRVLLEFSPKMAENICRNKLIIESNRHIYTPEFGQLVKDFYLYL